MTEDYDTSIRATIEKRQAKVDAEWEKAVAKALAKHGADDLYGIPREELHQLRKTFAEKSRIAHGREPKWGDPSPELMKEIREASGTNGVPVPRAERPVDPEATIPCIDTGCSQLAKTPRGMRKHIVFRHPERTPDEVEKFLSNFTA